MTDSITISFTPQQLDAVANALGQAPYIVAAPILGEISKQVAAHNQQQAGAGQAPNASDPLPLP